ncbi:MAG: efflux RND transporter periplasmic adaptor subunit [Pirellula sp.]|jgi:cobalt-zinc-cadmium efflux system membrane fusion protein|nr:efflux RND transporter periplasmic adaptor subunit [Pirellula sp.]
MNHFFTKFAPGLIVAILLVSCWYSVHLLLTQSPATDTQEAASNLPGDADIVTLPAGKLTAANLETSSVQSHVLEMANIITGRIQYDERKHVDIKAPLDGLLQEIVVTPGEQVGRGELIAIMRSPDIGQARSDVIKRKRELDLATQILHRESTIADNLSKLLAKITPPANTSTSELNTDESALGTYRLEILTAHAKLQLAQELLNNIQPLAETGAIPGRTIRERQAELQIARSTFQTACDQALYNSTQSKFASEAKVAEAQRQFHLAQQSLEALLGYKDIDDSSNLTSEEALSRLEIRAPFSGTIESRGFANQERVSKGDSIMALANTTSLYVSANLREGDWSAISLTAGTKIKVEVPALEHRSFDAVVSFVGREIDRESKAIPLVATIDNPEGLLRPGMFVRVTIPVGKPRQAITISSNAIVQHENHSFAFVDLGGGRFRKVDVRTGQATEDWVEVLDGLRLGDAVVARGAFLLKSELLLQGETE